jgi:hypothetical protein
MDVGSGVATTSTSSASDTVYSTTSEMPAPVSSSTRSKRGATASITFCSCSRTSGVMREYSTMPDPASSTEKPPGAGRMASSSELLPVNTSCSVILGNRFSTTSRLARPRSASSTSTFWPWRASAAARLALTKVLPTPPLPLVMAVMRDRLGGDAGALIRVLGLKVVSNSNCRSSVLTSDTALSPAAPGCGPAPWRGRAAGRHVRSTAPGVERTHCGAKAPPMLTVTSICCAAGR